MAELRQYDIAGAAMQGFQQGRAIRNQNQLNQLASQAYSTAPEGQNALLGQIAQISPQAAAAQQQQFQQGEDRTADQLRGLVRFIDDARATGDEKRVNAALQSAGPFIQKLTGRAPPTQWTEDFNPGWEQLKAQVAMYGSPASAASGVQSTYVDGEGNRVAIMRDGSTQILGKNDTGATQQTISINGPDGRPAQYTFDRRTGNYVPAGAGMAAQAQPAAQAPTFAQGQGQQAIDQIAASANAMIAQGIPEAQVEAWAASQLGGGQVSDGIPAGNQLRTTQTIVGNPSQFVGQSSAEKAEAEARARAGVEIETAPILQDIKTQGDLDRAAGLQRLEGAAETLSSAPGAIATIQQSIDSIDALLNSDNLGSIVGLGYVNPLNQIPGSAGRGLIARADQVGGQAFLAAFNQLKGGGAITEKEGEAATRAMARLDRTQSEADYRAALRDLKAAIAPAIQRQREALSRAQQTVGGGATSAPVQRARNPQTGEVLELRNGQWVPAR